MMPSLDLSSCRCSTGVMRRLRACSPGVGQVRAHSVEQAMLPSAGTADIMLWRLYMRCLIESEDLRAPWRGLRSKDGIGATHSPGGEFLHA